MLPGRGPFGGEIGVTAMPVYETARLVPHPYRLGPCVGRKGVAGRVDGRPDHHSHPAGPREPGTRSQNRTGSLQRDRYDGEPRLGGDNECAHLERAQSRHARRTPLG